MNFTAQTRVGTYSYEILPSSGALAIGDRIRSVQSGQGVPFSEGTFTATTYYVPTSPPPTPYVQPVPAPTAGLAPDSDPAGRDGRLGAGDDSIVSELTIGANPNPSHPNQFVSTGTISFQMDHQRGSDLTFTLTAPNNRTFTFSGASLTFPNPTVNLGAAIKGSPVDGNYFLTITDNVGGATGTLTSWSLTLTATTPSVHVQNNNFMDQDANGVTNQLPSTGVGPRDAYSAPASLGGSGFTYNPATFFPTPYNQDTLPLIVPGPHIASTHVAGNPVTSDNLVLNSTVSSIDITFDRNMGPGATPAPAQVLRVMGPTGLIVGFNPTQGNPNGRTPCWPTRSAPTPTRSTRGPTGSGSRPSN